MQKDISIYTESNPNPQSMKFVFDFLLIEDEQIFDSSEEERVDHCPLAIALFDLGYIKRVFFMHNFITLTKHSTVEWSDIIPELKNFLKKYLKSEKPVFTENIALKKEPIGGSEKVQRILQILEEYVKPAVEMDGGAIQFHNFNENTGVLTLTLQGACSGCPSSMLTLKAGIENLMRRMIPEVKEVVAQEEY